MFYLGCPYPTLPTQMAIILRFLTNGGFSSLLSSSLPPPHGLFQSQSQKHQAPPIPILPNYRLCAPLFTNHKWLGDKVIYHLGLHVNCLISWATRFWGPALSITIDNKRQSLNTFFQEQSLSTYPEDMKLFCLLVITNVMRGDMLASSYFWFLFLPTFPRMTHP